MREIKFRAWDNWLTKFVDPSDRFADEVYVGQDGGVYAYSCDEGGCDFRAITDGRYEIVWWTGLKDKNGKEIYEGDILNAGGLGNLVVKFGLYDNGEHYEDHDSGCGFYLVGDGHIHGITYINFHKTCPVIGNIYENPELLEAKNGS